jgi:DNA polymerase-3 subunit gamma/tau
MMFRFVESQDVVGCVTLVNDMLMTGRDLNQFISEFIWYLRGLMLVDVSKQGGELLDVSQEQLALMEEEAKMVDVDVLIRYIRILSDLSNQIRYASQKRVLVEVTFVKLCRPQMDEKQDVTTLSARLAAVEKQLEQGVVSVAAQSSTMVENKIEEKEASKPKILPKALPEDVTAVIKRWNEILMAYGQPGENMLSQAKKVVSEQGSLLLQFTDKLNEDFFLQNDGQELQCLTLVVQNLIGKEITIETRTVDAVVDEEYEDISRMIHFDGIEYQ